MSDFGGPDYQVHILGDVNWPGTYRVSVSTRLMEVLQMAGGITDQGSERRVEIRREGSGKRVADLLSFKLLGNLDANPYLLDNDIIFIPHRQKTVQIAGTVRMPGIYEVKGEKNLEDLVRLAGGLTVGAATDAPVKVIRFEGGQKEVIDIDNTPEARRNVDLRNGDYFVVPHFLTEKKRFDYNLAALPGDNGLFYPSLDNRVFVIGAVTKPGPYPYSPHYSFQHYITLAGGMTKLAKQRKGKIITAEGKVIRSPVDAEVGAGDTIVVPERYMGPDTFLSLVLGLTTSVLGITTTVLTLSK